MRPLHSSVSCRLQMSASRTTHLSQLCRRSASAWVPSWGVRFLMVRVSSVWPFVPSMPSRERLLGPPLLPCWLLLFVPTSIVCARSWPCRVMLLFFETCMISWYVPALMVMRLGAVLLAGSASVAPCTVQNEPLPSSATVRADRSLGAAAAVVNRHADEPDTEKVPPPGGLIAPASTFT